MSSLETASHAYKHLIGFKCHQQEKEMKKGRGVGEERKAKQRGKWERMMLKNRDREAERKNREKEAVTTGGEEETWSCREEKSRCNWEGK